MTTASSASTPQAGIFALGTRYHHHLELDLLPAASDTDICTALDALREPNVTAGASNLVIGFGSALWSRIAPSAIAEDLAPFRAVVGRDHTAPATQHDIWIWIHGSGADSVHDAADAAAAALAPVAGLADEESCFVYHDSRDLTGFIDGTANPTPAEAPTEACIPHGRPGAGGSHVIIQRWVHDLDAFNRLDVPDQEDVFGRRKADSTSIPKPDRPADAHISLAEIHDEDGEEREIYRRSVPWGTVARRGLQFVGFSAERDRFDQMLAQIYGTDGRPLRDRLLDFTTAVSGSYYFAPTIEELLQLGIGTD